LKEANTTHWLTPNTNATDIYQFAAVGGGFRYNTGNFAYIKQTGLYLSTSTMMDMHYDSEWVSLEGGGSATGASVRLIKDDSTNSGIMTDNSGYTYKTVKIGNQVWMASNLRGTKYRNGNDISIVTDNTTWSTLTSGACCSYNNNDAWAYADNYVINDTYVEIYVDYLYDGTNWKMYAYSVYAGSPSAVVVNTNVTITFNYSYYDAAAGRSFNVSGANLTISSGQSQSTSTIIGGYFTGLTLLSVSPTNSGTYHYAKGGL